jgi:electron transfer flavoprotein beta subunit
MKIVVCVKDVPDTAAKITISGTNGIDESVKFVLSPYDEYAVEEALKLKGKEGGEVVIVSVGKSSAIKSLRSALAMGAERGVLVTTDSDVDPVVTSQALAKVIQDEGDVDMVFMGKQSVDSEGMQTQYRLGALLDMPVASNVIVFDKQGDKVVVESEIEGGARQVIEMTTPCIVAATKGLNEPRYPKLPDIMKATKKEVKQLELASLGLDAPASSMEVTELSYPPEKPEGKMVEGEDPKQIAEELVRLLREEAKVL